MLTLIPIFQGLASGPDDPRLGIATERLLRLLPQEGLRPVVLTDQPEIARLATQRGVQAQIMAAQESQLAELTPPGTDIAVQKLLADHPPHTEVLLLDWRSPFLDHDGILNAIKLFEHNRPRVLCSVRACRQHPMRMNWHLKTILAGTLHPLPPPAAAPTTGCRCQPQTRRVSQPFPRQLLGRAAKTLGVSLRKLRPWALALTPDGNEILALAVRTDHGLQVFFPRLSLTQPGTVLSCLAVDTAIPGEWEELFIPLDSTSAVPFFPLPERFRRATALPFCLLTETVEGEYHLHLPFQPDQKLWQPEALFGHHRDIQTKRIIQGRQDTPPVLETDGSLIIACLKDLLILPALLEEGQAEGFLLAANDHDKHHAWPGQLLTTAKRDLATQPAYPTKNQPPECTVE